MKYKFENIGNLDAGFLSIEKEKINFKYGFNGIGKSTIVKAIQYMYSQNEQKEKLEKVLHSLRTGKEKVLPTKIKNDFSSICVYDKDYFSHLFSQPDLLNDSYELIINDSTYSAYLTEITNKLNILKNKIEKTDFGEKMKLLQKNMDKEVLYLKDNGQINSKKNHT